MQRDRTRARAAWLIPNSITASGLHLKKTAQRFVRLLVEKNPSSLRYLKLCTSRVQRTAQPARAPWGFDAAPSSRAIRLECAGAGPDAQFIQAFRTFLAADSSVIGFIDLILRSSVGDWWTAILARSRKNIRDPLDLVSANFEKGQCSFSTFKPAWSILRAEIFRIRHSSAYGFWKCRESHFQNDRRSKVSW